MKKLAGWIAAILVAIWIIRNPAAAGTTVHAWFNDVVTFFNHLAA